MISYFYNVKHSKEYLEIMAVMKNSLTRDVGDLEKKLHALIEISEKKTYTNMNQILNEIEELKEQIIEKQNQIYKIDVLLDDK